MKAVISERVDGTWWIKLQLPRNTPDLQVMEVYNDKASAKRGAKRYLKRFGFEGNEVIVQEQPY